MILVRTMAAASALLFAAGPAHADVVIEGESAALYESACDDDEPMEPRLVGTAGTMFFPGEGCSATYVGHATTIVSFRYRLSGTTGTICGTVRVEVPNTGVPIATSDVCATNDTWATGTFPLGANVGVGGFDVAWWPADSTDNLWLDYLTGDVAY